jgi:hypothetical protein
VLHSYVIRLVPQLPAGEIVGEVEAVESGERTAIRNLDELLAALGVVPPDEGWVAAPL